MTKTENYWIVYHVVFNKIYQTTNKSEYKVQTKSDKVQQNIRMKVLGGNVILLKVILMNGIAIFP